jgi:quinolinate synthase
MRVVAAQAFRSGQLPPEAAKAGQHLVCTSEASHSHLAVVLDQVDLIAFPEAKLSDELRREADGKRVSPFRDMHRDLLGWIYVHKSISY